VKGDGGLAGEGSVVGVQSFIPGISAPCHLYLAV